MIVGIDHGYYAIKTKHVSFPSGIIEYDWDIFNNHTKDMFLYENGKWRAFSVPEKLKPPKSYQKKQTKKKNQPER